MKKILAVLLCLMMLLAVGCGEKDASQSGSGAESQSAGSQSAESQPEEQGPAYPVRADRNLLTGEYDEGAHTVRPVAVMINDLPGAYPHWGISSARVVVEALSEGKYPSMMCLLDNRSEMPQMGPVGPGRDIMWQLAMPADSVLMQIGGNIYAENLLNQYQYQNLDGYYVGVTAFDFDRDRDAAGYPNEYCWYTKQELLNNGMNQYGMDPATDEALPLLEFSGETVVPEGSQPANRLQIGFSPEATVPLYYEDGRYLKDSYNGDLHMDVANDTQLAFENCVVLFCAAGVKDDGYTRDYDLTEGTGVYMTQGTYLPIRWQKGRPEQPVRLFTMEGEPVLVNPGRTYLAVYGGFDGQWIAVQQDDTALELPEVPGTAPAEPDPAESVPEEAAPEEE